tara:strand:+ start:692 stop:934 length:243 start_codon:yes stop_codon:yes gene_type:complete
MTAPYFIDEETGRFIDHCVCAECGGSENECQCEVDRTLEDRIRNYSKERWMYQTPKLVFTVNQPSLESLVPELMKKVRKA